MFRWFLVLAVILAPIAIWQLAWFVSHSPAVPYNMREMFSLISLYTATRIWGSLICVGIAISIVGLLPTETWWQRTMLFGIPVICLVIAFTLLEEAIPHETIDDIAGTRLWRVDPFYERLVRFSSPFLAIVLAIGLGVRFAELMPWRHQSNRLSPLLWTTVVVCVGWYFAYNVTIRWATTDNIVELLPSEGKSSRLFALFGSLALVGFTCQLMHYVFWANHYRIGIVSLAFLLVLFGIPIHWQLANFGTAAAINKYGKTFSTLQFLLSSDRSNYLSSSEIFKRFFFSYLLLYFLVFLALVGYSQLTNLLGRFCSKFLLNTAENPIKQSPSTSHFAVRHQSARKWGRLIFFFCCFYIPFASWYPFAFQAQSQVSVFQLLHESVRNKISKTDFLANFIVGLITGISGIFAFCDNRSTSSGRCNLSVKRASVACKSTVLLFVFVCLWSLIAESGQAWCPSRVPSIYDCFAQGLGCIAALPFFFLLSFCIVWLPDENLPRSINRTVLKLYTCLFVAWAIFPGIPSISPSEVNFKFNALIYESDWSYLSTYHSKHHWFKLYETCLSGIAAIPVGIAVSLHFEAPKEWLQVAERVSLVMAIMLVLELSKIFIYDRAPSIHVGFITMIGGVVGVLLSTKYQASR